MHPNKKCKSKINTNDINITYKHGRKLGDLIQSNRDVVANLDNELG